MSTAYEVFSKLDYGCIGDGVTDDGVAIQNFLNDTSGKQLILEPGIYKYTTPLIIRPSGVFMKGTDGNGLFSSILKPINCRAFTISGTHNVLIQNIMIWPQGTNPPAQFIIIENSYNIQLRDIRIHTSSNTYLPLQAVIQQQRTSSGTCNDVIFDHLIIRNDGGGNFPIGINFMTDCGSASVHECDIETCTYGIVHAGGRVKVIGGYMERMGVHGVVLSALGDHTACFSMLGGHIGMAGPGGIPVKITHGAKNVRMTGTYCSTIGQYQAFVYGLNESECIKIDIANPKKNMFGTIINPMPDGVVQFG